MSELSNSKQSLSLSFTVVLASVLVTVFAPICSAVTTYANDPVESNSARALAMGGVSIVVADGSVSHLSNPAALVLVPRSMITGGVNLDQVSEESFDADEQELDNDQLYFNPLRSQGFVIKNGEVFTGSVSRGMFFDYYTKREERDEDEFTSYESKGGLYAFSASVAKQVIPKVSIGGSLNVLRGNTDIESRYTSERSTYGWIIESTETGTNFSLGGLYTLTDQVTVGAVYRTSADITRKRTITRKENGKAGDTDSAKEKWTYPVAMGAGAMYRHERVFLVGEIHRANWTDYEWHETGGSPLRPEYSNLTTFHIGVEYEASAPSLSSKPLLLRGGFYTSPFHFLEELGTDETTGYFVTAGIGIDAEDFRIDIAGQIGQKKFTEPESEKEYEASIKSVLGTVSYQFDWPK